VAGRCRDEGIYREWRIIEALDGTDVPHTKAVAMCTDTSILGRAFYLMGFVDGWSPMDQRGWPAPFDADLAARQGLAISWRRASRYWRRSTGRGKAWVTWGGPTASTNVRSTAGPPSSTASRAGAEP
jgi:hypothetical protein